MIASPYPLFLSKLFAIMRYSILLFAAASCISFTACTSGGSGHEGHSGSTTAQAPPTPAAPPSSKLKEQGTTALMDLLTEYYALKDAFVATNATKVADAARAFKTKTDALETVLAADSTSGPGFQARVDTMSKATDAMLAAKDETCEQQRLQFEKVSDQVFALSKEAELKNAGVYRQYCPMAFNDKGAYWLSKEAEIRNPYFGKKMLECGEVADSSLH